MITILDKINKKRELAEEIKNFYKPCGFPIVMDRRSIESDKNYIEVAIYLSKEYVIHAQCNIKNCESAKILGYTYDLYGCEIIKLDEDESLEKNGDNVPYPREDNTYVSSFDFNMREQMLNFLLNWEGKYKNKFEEIVRLYDEKKKKEEEFIMFVYKEEQK